MPYVAELSRNQPTAFVFLIDQSSSMAEPFGLQPEKAKSQGVADAINRLLQNLVLKCAKGDGIRDYFHVGVVGYGGAATWALGGDLAGHKLVRIGELASFNSATARAVENGSTAVAQWRTRAFVKGLVAKHGASGVGRLLEVIS